MCLLELTSSLVLINYDFCCARSPLNNEKRDGTFICAGCGAPVFTTSMKFNSGTGVRGSFFVGFSFPFARGAVP